MFGRVRRIINLYRLLWAEDRLAALESTANRLRASLRNQGATLENHSTTLQHLSASLQEQGLGLQDHVKRLHEQVDLLKSSLEVPQKLVDEYFDWKADNPIPERPLVSVAVATYNRAALLTERCIPSVLGQTYDNLELIVVGDGCTDETEDAVAEIRDPRLKFVNLPERSSYPADPERRWMVAGTRPTNEAVSIARGDFITHLDDDDEYILDRLEKLVACATENDCDVVWHPYWFESDAGEWELQESWDFAPGHVTNSSAMYRSWFTRFESDPGAHLLMEPGDWNRFRKIKYVDPPAMRYPEPLLRKHRDNG